MAYVAWLAYPQVMCLGGPQTISIQPDTLAVQTSKYAIHIAFHVASLGNSCCISGFRTPWAKPLFRCCGVALS